MKKPIENYWKGRLVGVKDALERNNFEAFLADNATKVRQARLCKRKFFPRPARKVFLGAVP